MPASPLTIDFSLGPDLVQHKSGVSGEKVKPMTAEGKLLTPKQIRARARRKRKRGVHLTEQEKLVLYRKPIEEWDLEELAHGRPRNSKGSFSGPNPQWIDRAVHEKSMEMYTAVVRSRIRGTTVTALDVLTELMTDTSVDEKGKPFVPASTKADLAKWLVEHTIGKPTQRIESDVSVKLQGILGQVMVNPTQDGGYAPAHFPGITMAMADGPADYEEEDDGDESEG